MCLGIPGRITEVFERGSLRMGRIDYGGVIQEACLAYVPEAIVGEYVIVHAGFAIQQMAPEEARETLAMWDEIIALDNSNSVPGNTPPAKPV
jgi:hydrogenase expression/formation protein HypC